MTKTIGDWAVSINDHERRKISFQKKIAVAQNCSLHYRTKKEQKNEVPDELKACNANKPYGIRLTEEELTQAFMYRRQGLRNVEIHEKFPHLKGSTIDRQMMLAKTHPLYISGKDIKK